jgi:hypothetical protein
MGDTQRSAPAVGDPHVAQRREQLDKALVHLRVDPTVVIKPGLIREAK